MSHIKSGYDIQHNVKMLCALCTIFSGKMLASCMKNVQNFNFPTPGVQRSDCCDQLVLHC